MVGGSFQASDKEDFTHPTVLYKISNVPQDNFNLIQLPEAGKYRFVRYMSPDGSHGNIAEFQVFAEKSNTPLKGKVIGTNGSWANTPTKTKYAALDKNPLTFFDAAEPNNNWVGLDFGEVHSIHSIQFLPRSDMNGIYAGDKYELFYWDYGWKSLGKQVAEGQYLQYTAVPKNALLWLRNLTAGKEERIFTYENKKQVWW
jgi:hypothetical protein